MARIVGVDGMNLTDLEHEVAAGGRFVSFPYCISLIVVTLRRSSDIHFLKVDDSAWGKIAAPCLVSLLLGWWGIPWGPIYTIGSLFTNLQGGKNITAEVMAHFRQTPNSGNASAAS